MKKLFLPANSDNYTRQVGFSLVEIMVGLTIGLLASVIILQVISNFEAQKRVTTGVADAQINGNIALQNITREIQQAGYGLYPLGLPSNQGPADSPLECTTLTINGANDATTPNRLTPLFIADDGQSDSITVRYGSTTSGGLFTSVDVAPVGTLVTVTSTLGCRAGDATLIVNGATCSMSAVSTTSGVVNATTLDMVNTTGAIVGTQLACLGAWSEITYSVNANGDLDRTSLGTAAVTDVEEIVNLQAQYGISTAPNSNTISQWVEPTAGGWNPPTVTDRNRIKAVRVAVVARNTKKEGKVNGQCVTTLACSATDSASPTGLCAWAGTAASPAPAIDLSAFDADWGCYRYRVFETILPLRNVIWSSGTL